jgi:DNA polymerase-3 subunit epsilon
VAFDLGFEEEGDTRSAMVAVPLSLRERPRVLRASAEEVVLHQRRLDALDKSAADGGLWRRLASQQVEVVE